MLGAGLGHSKEMAKKTRRRLERVKERSYFKNKDVSYKRINDSEELNIREASLEEKENIRKMIQQVKIEMRKKIFLSVLISIIIIAFAIFGVLYFFDVQL